ncbi:MAG: transposase [Chloroflexi bacterium]|nr:transposase [Chloroflexota bacterium]
MSQDANDKVKEEMPNTEVVAKAKRRRFTAAEKLRVLREAEACRGSGEIGALLRRKGLYSSYLTTWRRQQELDVSQSVFAITYFGHDPWNKVKLIAGNSELEVLSRS